MSKAVVFLAWLVALGLHYRKKVPSRPPKQLTEVRDAALAPLLVSDQLPKRCSRLIKAERGKTGTTPKKDTPWPPAPTKYKKEIAQNVREAAQENNGRGMAHAYLRDYA